MLRDSYIIFFILNSRIAPRRFLVIVVGINVCSNKFSTASLF